jgi:hypothetical protein
MLDPIANKISLQIASVVILLLLTPACLSGKPVSGEENNQIAQSAPENFREDDTVPEDLAEEADIENFVKTEMTKEGSPAPSSEPDTNEVSSGEEAALPNPKSDLSETEKSDITKENETEKLAETKRDESTTSQSEETPAEKKESSPQGKGESINKRKLTNQGVKKPRPQSSASPAASAKSRSKITTELPKAPVLGTKKETQPRMINSPEWSKHENAVDDFMSQLEGVPGQENKKPTPLVETNKRNTLENDSTERVFQEALKLNNGKKDDNAPEDKKPESSLDYREHQAIEIKNRKSVVAEPLNSGNDRRKSAPTRTIPPGYKKREQDMPHNFVLPSPLDK